MTTGINLETYHSVRLLRRPRVALSACLAGHDVRYDGIRKTQPMLQQTLGEHVDWCPVCPEVAAGMGVPRPPVQLQHKGNQICVVEVAAPHRDVSAQLRDGVTTSTNLLQQHKPDAIVLKARSPSCGLGNTPLIDSRTQTAGLTDGLFAAACRQNFSQALLIDEAQLQTQQQNQRLAITLLLTIDATHGGVTPSDALLTHYLRHGLTLTTDAPIAPSLMQQLGTWPDTRIDVVFNDLFARKPL